MPFYIKYCATEMPWPARHILHLNKNNIIIIFYMKMIPSNTTNHVAIVERDRRRISFQTGRLLRFGISSKDDPFPTFETKTRSRGAATTQHDTL